jgi:hypothetical protein
MLYIERTIDRKTANAKKCVNILTGGFLRSMLNQLYSGGDAMKKISLVVIMILITVSPLMADSIEDIHKAILQSDLETALTYSESSEQEGLILLSIAHKEYLNLLAESLLLLSEEKSTEPICDEIVNEFIEVRAIYLKLVDKIDKKTEDVMWELVLESPLSVTDSMQKGASLYSDYLFNLLIRKYPKDYAEVKSIILGYLPLAYENRLLLLTVNPPAKEDLLKVLMEEKPYRLDMDLSKVREYLSN